MRRCGRKEETVFIGLGSNLGPKEEHIKRALVLLSKVRGMRLERVASLYRTEPLGLKCQDWFLNTVAAFKTVLSPRRLLCVLLCAEKRLGRVRSVRFGPRNIDLDILLFGSRLIDEPGLAVPHPRLAERAFVLVPLAELEPDLVLPGGKCTVAELARALKREQAVEKAGPPPW